jgi:hypothetical protein
MPAAAFLAGDRIEVFVDHSEVATALADDVSLHDHAPVPGVSGIETR